MRIVRLDGEADFAGWRAAVRALLAADVAPEEVDWHVAGAAPGLFPDEAAAAGTPAANAPAGTPAFRVPRSALDLAQAAICHSDPQRFRLLHRLVHDLRTEPHRMQIATDPLLARVSALAQAVRRDIHKMHAFLRFREVGAAHGPHFIAWFEPGHHIVEAAAPFFQRRFASMRWSILTPRRSVHWDGDALLFAEGVPRQAAPSEDVVEDLWRGYYAAIFNPARLKLATMRREMPKKYWRNLPEAPLIKPLTDMSFERTQAMLQAPAAAPRPVRQKAPAGPRDEAQARSQEDRDLAALREDARSCRACPLWADATQTVFGEGGDKADLVFVGEQPGDKEDLAGRPFVGPAGRLFDRALEEAGIDRRRTYVTNAVKHFKFEPRGKFRLHKKPNAGEIDACRWWVSREIDLIKPRLAVALGATAVQSLLGKAAPIGANRGKVLDSPLGCAVFVTVHPSYLLRLPDEEARRVEFARFVEDLKAVRQAVAA